MRHRRKTSLWRTLLSAVLWTQLALGATLALATTGAAAVGLSPFAITSGSMEPAIPTGALVWAAPADATQLAEGDVVAFQLGGQTIVHRIAECREDGFVTKGDANSAPDPALTSPDSIAGKVVGHLPFAGAALLWPQRNRATCVVALLGLNGLAAAAAAAELIVRSRKGEKDGANASRGQEGTFQGFGESRSNHRGLHRRVRRSRHGLLHR